MNKQGIVFCLIEHDHALEDLVDEDGDLLVDHHLLRDLSHRVGFKP